MDEIKLFIKQAIAYIKILVPFTNITIKNIKQVIFDIKRAHNKK